MNKANEFIEKRLLYIEAIKKSLNDFKEMEIKFDEDDIENRIKQVDFKATIIGTMVLLGELSVHYLHLSKYLKEPENGRIQG